MNDEIELENEELEDEYTPPKLSRYDITAYPADYTISTILSKYGKTIVVPDFQRGYVWSKEILRQSKLIESFLIGLPVPQIFLFQKKDEKELLIIDGFQRLNTLHRFCNNEFALDGVQSDFKGMRYADLGQIEKEEFDNTTLRAIIIRQLTPDDNYTSMYHIFERLNTGGLTLSPMEIRKAISGGEFFATLANINDDQNWRAITNRKIAEPRLRDIEWILRVFCISLFGLKDYNDSMKDYLTEHLSKNRNKAFEIEREKFKTICAEIKKQLGIKPFHIPSGRLNLSVLDAVLCSLMKANTFSDLKSKYEALISDADFKAEMQSRGATKKPAIENRIRIANKYLQ